MRKLFLATGALIAACSTPALAQDAKPVDIYVGAVAGWDRVTLDYESEDGSEDGLMYGVTAGVDYTFGADEGPFLGVEVEYADSDVSESATDLLIIGDEAKLSAGRDLYIGARAGFHASNWIKLYAKGGYTNAKVKGRYFDGVDTYRDSLDMDGFRIGAGAESSLGGPVALRVEYRYSDYGEAEYEGFDTGVSASRNQVVASLLAKF